EAFALHLFAGELTGAAHRLRLLASLLFRGFFVMAAELHLAENALALHLFLQRLESLVDVVVTDENLHAAFLLNGSLVVGCAAGRKRPAESGANSRAGIKSPSGDTGFRGGRRSGARGFGDGRPWLTGDQRLG